MSIETEGNLVRFPDFFQQANKRSREPLCIFPALSVSLNLGFLKSLDKKKSIFGSFLKLSSGYRNKILVGDFIAVFSELRQS